MGEREKERLFIKIDLASLEALQVLPALVYSTLELLGWTVFLLATPDPGSSPTVSNVLTSILNTSACEAQILPHLTGQIKSGWEQSRKQGIMVPEVLRKV